MMTTTGATTGVTTMTAERINPARWGIRQRVVGASVVLLAAALAVTLLVTWLTLVNRVEGEIDVALAQEIEELRQLATGTDPATGVAFGANARPIFDTFLNRNVPADNEAFYTYVDGRFFLASFNAPLELARDTQLTARWGDVLTPTWGTTDTAVGEARFLAAPLVAETGAIGTFVVVHFPADDRADVARVIRTAAIAGATVLLLAAAFAWSMAGRVLQPIRELTDTAQGITDTDLSGRIPVTGTDELSELGATFNAMLERLEVGFSGQRQFLDDVAHELRTPITIAQGHLELMGDDPVERADTIRIVNDELDRMNRYVGDLLLLAKSETADFLRPEPVDLGELAQTLRAKVEALADRRWAIDVAPAPGVVAIVADPGRLTQAVLNLATNAVQHTADGEVVALGIEAVGSSVEPTGARLWVRDTGRGLEPGLAERLFDRRFRGAASRAERADGMGLGLSIVAAIARAHGGSVAAGDAPGGGARFTITIPSVPPAADAGATATRATDTRASEEHRG